ncbi:MULTISPECIES: Crp/Fnr family transcriptional regulator [Methylobacillus]|uniref:Cyclic nucleotide-binding domain (cNMP-BD) protein n=2 Tax=Methylobacillus flagellatus (strain ATCC 51484 / DSM 6875 / VKM B-1610 / KT) TaxID=265072 RepID=Q1GZZ4_METFK|nr:MULTISPECIES: cyclic nucleotide-binding domain-containing protein [Methylobacillus]ABE50193.1 cyclic nucleotide-binding domain (cNMP-BD) protein [Methylobacillus flagellatus KT]MPS48466.1 cyclic nucleotide-binding domain-containing protein [Methylobacillus sp.]
MYPDLVHLGGADKYFEEILEIVNKIKLFGDFSNEEVRYLCSYMQCYAAPRDCQLLTEGDPGDYLLLILTGEVNVIKDIPNKGIQTIAKVGAGAIIGEMSMIDGMPRSASCVASLPTDFAVLSRDALYQLLANMPKLGNKVLIRLLQLLTARFRESYDRILPKTLGELI